MLPVFESVYREFLLKLPTSLVSRAFGVLSEVALPRPLQGAVNAGFARFAGINLSESELEPGAYRTLNAFFTRRLKAGTHRVDTAPGALISPVDGRVAQFGPIEDGTLIQAKGRRYRLDDLMGYEQDARPFEKGYYITIYLSPRDYHRIHSPVAGVIDAIAYLPGRLLPVNAFAVRNYDDLFPRNERLITHIRSQSERRVAVIKVGATCVGRISVPYYPFQTNVEETAAFRKELGEIPVGLADEVGTFNLGSTVVLVFDGAFSMDSRWESGMPVRLGEKLGSWT